MIITPTQAATSMYVGFVNVSLWYYISTERLSPHNHQPTNHPSNHPSNHPTTIQQSNHPTNHPTTKATTQQPFHQTNHPTPDVVRLVFLAFCLLLALFITCLYSLLLTPWKRLHGHSPPGRRRYTAARCSNTCTPQEGSKVLPFTIFPALPAQYGGISVGSSSTRWTKCCCAMAPTHNRHTNWHQHDFKTYKHVSHADSLFTCTAALHCQVTADLQWTMKDLRVSAVKCSAIQWLPGCYTDGLQIDR